MVFLEDLKGYKLLDFKEIYTDYRLDRVIITFEENYILEIFWDMAFGDDIWLTCSTHLMNVKGYMLIEIKLENSKYSSNLDSIILKFSNGFDVKISVDYTHVEDCWLSYLLNKEEN